MEIPAKKAINFDLDTKKMGNYFANYTQGYHELEKSFKKQQFEHDQGSGYISSKELTNKEAIDAITNVAQENPWLPDCARRFRITEPTVLYEGELLLDKIGEQLVRSSGAAASAAPQAATVPSPALAVMRAGYKPKKNVAAAGLEDTKIME